MTKSIISVHRSQFTVYSSQFKQMSSRVTKCTVCGESGHTRIHCLDMCGMCNGDSRRCGCQEPPSKKKKASSKKNPKAAKKTADRRQQPPPLSPPPLSSTPETEVNYKSLCRQLQQKNQQLGKAYKDIKTKFDALERKCLEQQEHLQQAQDDSDEMAQFVREAEGKRSRPWSGNYTSYRATEPSPPPKRLLLRRSTATTSKKYIADKRMCCPSWRRGNAASTMRAEWLEQHAAPSEISWASPN